MPRRSRKKTRPRIPTGAKRRRRAAKPVPPPIVCASPPCAMPEIED